MKKHDFGLFFFSGGLVLLVIQFLVILFKTLNGTLSLDDSFFVEEIKLADVISAIWPSLFGTVLLIVLYIRRFIKGKEAMLVLVGGILWVIQLLNLYEADYELTNFLLRYILGIIGIVLVFATGLYEAYVIKRYENSAD